MPQPTRVWYLRMDDPAALRPARPVEGISMVQAELPLGALNRFFYVEIGRGHHWVDLLPWSADRWQAFAESVETWIAWDRGTPAGYAELRPNGRGAIDVAHFGMLPPFRGRGIGGHMLTEVVRRAWSLGPVQVTLNTCELDGQRALPNYLARGFEVVREVVEQRRRAGVDTPVG